MKTLIASSLFVSLVLSAKAINPVGFSNDTADQISRTVVHKDGTYTTTQKDKDTRTLVRETKKRNNTLIMRSEFALDEFGRERKGRVFDGQNNLLFISEFVYEGDELIEERVFDSKGKMVRRLMYKVKVVSKLDGRSRPALVSYQNGKPIGDLVALDDPSVFSTTSTHAHSSDSKQNSGGEKWIRSKDGSLVPVPSGAVQFPQTKKGNNSSSNKAVSDSKPKRKFRIFNRNK
jgi:predicted GIY-YIG superfamily endonuclease